MIIIPSIDIIDDKVVRLEKGDYSKTTIYSNSVFETVSEYSNNDFNLIHIVDLMGSKNGELLITDTLKKIKKDFDVKIQLGGGIRSLSDAEKLFDLEIDYLVIGSLSINDKKEFEKIISLFSPEKIIVAADVKDNKIAVKGWTETTDVSLTEHIIYCNSVGINKFLITDISKDGMLSGPAVLLYKNLIEQFPSVKIIASGGVSSINDLIELKELGLYAAVVGRAIYENKINLKEMKELAV